MTPADNPLVWLVDNESLSAAESRELIRTRAATWGHKTRRLENRTRGRSKAPEVHSNVLEPYL